MRAVSGAAACSADISARCNVLMRHFAFDSIRRFPSFRNLRTRYPCHSQQSLAGHPQVRQREQRDHVCRVLGQAAKPYLQQTKLALDHPEWMLHSRTDTRFARFARLQRALLPTVFHRLDLAPLGGDLPAQSLTLDSVLRAGVASIGMHHLFLAVQQRLDLLDISLV